MGRKAKPNEICPFCDSNKKYKKCCGSAASLAAAADAPGAEVAAAPAARGYDPNDQPRNVEELASEKKYMGLVKRMLKDGRMDAELKANVLDGAGRAGNLELMRLLIKKKADVNGVMKKKSKHDVNHSPLFHASMRGQVEAVKLLLDAKADVERTDNGAATPLMIASAFRHFDVVRVLLDAGADVDAVDKTGSSALILAGQHAPGTAPPQDGEESFTAEEIEEATGVRPLSVEESSNDEATMAQVKVMTALIDAYVELDHTNGYGATALFMASQGGQVAAVRLLIDAKAAINKRLPNGASALDHAAANGHTAVVRLLIKSGAEDSNTTSDVGPAVTRVEQWSAVQRNPELKAVLARHRCGACHTLLNDRKNSMCSRCKQVGYCSRECQKKHWKAHKQVCKKLAEGDSDALRDRQWELDKQLVHSQVMPGMLDPNNTNWDDVSRERICRALARGSGTYPFSDTGPYPPPKPSSEEESMWGPLPEPFTGMEDPQDVDDHVSAQIMGTHGGGVDSPPEGGRTGRQDSSNHSSVHEMD